MISSSNSLPLNLAARAYPSVADPRSHRLPLAMTLLALTLVLGVGCGGGNSYSEPPVNAANPMVQLQVTPRRVELTANRQFQLNAQITGAPPDSVRWYVSSGDGGGISPTGLYYSPKDPGTYLVVCQASTAPNVRETVEIKVHPEPMAHRLTADHTQVQRGQAVVLTPEFSGGTAVLLPFGTPVTSQHPITIHPSESVTCVLRVTNPLGDTAERTVHVRVGTVRVPAEPGNLSGTGASGTPAGAGAGDPGGRSAGNPAGSPAGAPAGTPAVSPAGAPAGTPAVSPAGAPAGTPAVSPAGAPAGTPAVSPAGAPAGTPAVSPAGAPAGTPAGSPGGDPAGTPAGSPAGAPTAPPTGSPAGAPAGAPTGSPGSEAAIAPAGSPAGAPGGSPGGDPAGAPTGSPAGTPPVTPVSGHSGGLWGTGDPDVFAILYSSANFTADVAIAPQAPTVINTTGDPAPVVFFLASGRLPDGLVLQEDGNLTGTPTAPGQYSFTMAASNGTRQVESGSIVYTVANAGQLALAYPALGASPVRTPLEPQVPTLDHATDGIITRYSVSGAFPQGLSLDTYTGILTGAARRPGTYSFTITARNWNRSATADLHYQFLPGPDPVLTYANQRFDTEDAILLSPTLDHLTINEATRFSLAQGELPAGLELVPERGDLMGTIATPGTYTFAIGLNDGIDQLTSAPVTFQVAPFVPLRVNLTAPVQVLEPGVRADLSWTLEGLPITASLTRNLVVETPGSGPDQQVHIPITVGDGSASVPVIRRQTYTLAVTGRPKPGRGLQAARSSVVLAAKGVDLLAGDPVRVQPPQGYSSGPAASAQWRKVTGAVFHDGRLFLAEGADHTLRRLNLADGSVDPFAGVLMGADAGLPFQVGGRLNAPGPMAVAGDRLLICDRGSHTLKVCPLEHPSALAVLAGHSGQRGGADGQGAAARFGTLMDVAVHAGSGIAFVADLEHGIRMVRLADGEVRTLVATPTVRNGQAWPALTRPVGLAVTAAGTLYLTTETRPGYPREANPVIQILVPQTPADLWGSAWELNRFAGQKGAGYQDGAINNPQEPQHSARFKNPVGLAVVGDSLIVADSGNNAIRKINLTTRLVTTLAGALSQDPRMVVRSVLPGNSDGPLADAKFRLPTRIVVGADASQLFIVDQAEKTLREIRHTDDPAQLAVGTLGTMAKQALREESKDGLAAGARFMTPTAVAVERKTGDAYVLDNKRLVRKVAVLGTSTISAGTVTTLIGAPGGIVNGDPRPATSPLTEATELGIDGRARLFILEPKKNAIRMYDRQELTTFLTPVSDPLPMIAGQTLRPDPRIHMAVRPGGTGLALAVSSYANARPGGHGAGWMVRLHGEGQAHPVVVSSDLQAEPLALAVDLANNVHVLTTDPVHQVCTIHTFGRPVGGTYGEPHQTRFGPGAAQGRILGLPEVKAMIADTKGNLFLTDSANALVWMMPAPAAGQPWSGDIFPMLGQASVHQLIGANVKAFSDPLYLPTGLGITGADDLVLTSGDAVYQVTAPGTAVHPWIPARTFAWTSQAPQRAAAVDPAAPAAPRPAGPNMNQVIAGRNRTRGIAAYEAAVAARGRGEEAIALRHFAQARHYFELFIEIVREGEEVDEVNSQYLANIPR